VNDEMVELEDSFVGYKGHKPGLFNHVDFLKDREINETDLTEGFRTNPSLLGFYAHQHALWDQLYSIVKLNLNVAMAQEEVNIRAEGGKPVASYVESQVLINPEVKRLNKLLTLVKGQKDLYSMAVTTMQDRAKSLSGLSFKRNAEIDGLHMHTGPSVNPRMSANEAKELARNLASRG
jgi:hypothetical protein